MPANLTFDALKAAVTSGEIDTVIVCLVDMQGRMQGKRFQAAHFVENAEETHCCNYLLATDMEMARQLCNVAAAPFKHRPGLIAKIERAEAIRRLMKYTLADEAKATQRLRFIDTYRSYIINYGLGRDVVQAWVERQGPNRWDSMETLLSSQILPVDLL